MKYKFKSGTTYRGVDAQEAGQELERIHVLSGGKLLVGQIIEYARAESSPIHNIFTWDDQKAAHLFREHEARKFLRVVIEVDSEGHERPAFWNVPLKIQVIDGQKQREESYYQSASRVASSPVEYEAALGLMKSKLESAQNGLNDLLGLAPKGQKSKVAKASSYVKQAQHVLGVIQVKSDDSHILKVVRKNPPNPGAERNGQ